MSATNETYLPTYEELYAPAINLTSAALKAGAPYFGVYCDIPSKEFMLCKKEEKDPRKCLKYNKQVSACANDFFHKVRDNCAVSFTNYWQCLDKAPEGQMQYKFCRKTQAAFDQCLEEKMQIARPEVGWLSQVRLFNSDRPKPVKTPKQYETLPETTDETIKTMPELAEISKRAKRIL